MKISSIILWRSAILIFLLLSVWATISASLRERYMFTRFSSEAYRYPWIGVALMILIMLGQSMLLDFLFRPHRFKKAYLQNGLAILVLLTLSGFAFFLFIVTDLPNYVYIPGQFTILLVLLLLIRLIISVIVFASRYFSKKVHSV